MSIMTEDMPWHEGEERMHHLMKVPNSENPMSPFLTPQAAYSLRTTPLLALGTVDDQGRPWTTVWGGESGFAQVIAPSMVGIKTMVDSRYDPVAEALFEGKSDGELVKAEGAGRTLAGLTIDLENRRRVKLVGKMVAGALSRDESLSDEAADITAGEVQLVTRIEGSLGNCPKYINCKHIYPAIPEAELVSDSNHLPSGACGLIAKADTFFISSSNHEMDMDCNIRGGPQGFVRIESNTSDGATLIWPEYSGNRIYSTVGNLLVSPRAGIVFPDFETGDVLYLTGETSVLVEKEAATALPRSNLAVRFRVTASRFVKRGLPFHGTQLEPSPYNPSIRFLRAERPDVAATLEADSKPINAAKLIHKQKITPTITRYRFSLSTPPAKPWRPGEYIALSFRDELDMGYSHMRDDDPRSLNDDYVRTFTISSPPNLGLHGEEFEIMVRTVGNVTTWMSMMNARAAIEIPVLGIAGDFHIASTPSTKGVIPFIAGGIGITPLLPSLADLDLKKVRLFWSLGIADLGLARDTFKRYPDLVESTVLFISGSLQGSPRQKTKLLDGMDGVRIERRRLRKEDLDEVADANHWYLCSGPGMRKDVLRWLEGKDVEFEDFY